MQRFDWHYHTPVLPFLSDNISHSNDSVQHLFSLEWTIYSITKRAIENRIYSLTSTFQKEPLIICF